MDIIVLTIKSDLVNENQRYRINFNILEKITRNVLTMLDNISYNNIVLIQENKNKQFKKSIYG